MSRFLFVETHSSIDLGDDLKDAQILLSEGFIEDAKKKFRKVLIMDPSHALALEALDAIQRQELDRIFGNEESKPYLKLESNYDQVSSVSELNNRKQIETLIEKLDQDFQLKLFEDSFHNNGSHLNEEHEVFFNQLKASLIDAAPQDWIDVGIAFFEMEYFLVASRLFQGAIEQFQLDPLQPFQSVISAASLLVRALIELKQPYEAISKIQAFVHDAEIQYREKVELFYLLGHIYHSMGDADLAFFYYNQVKKIDPHYRDFY